MEGVDIPGYFIVEFNARKVVTPRPGPLEYYVRFLPLDRLLIYSSFESGSLQELHTRIRRYFPQIPSNYHITYHTTELVIGLGEEIEISSEAWGAVIPKIKKLIVKATDPRTFISQGISKVGPSNYPVTNQATIKDTGKRNDNGKGGNDRNHNQATHLTRGS